PSSLRALRFLCVLCENLFSSRKGRKGFSFILRALRGSLHTLRKLTFPRKGRKGLFHAKSAKCFFSLRALRISLRSLREPVFYTISTFKGNLRCLAICSKCSFFSAVEE